MLSQPSPSNLSEALINVKKIEKNFLTRQSTFLDRDRNKIRANVDRHMESFLQITRRRHETWYRHDKYFREAIRKEKDQHEKRKDRYRRKVLQSNPNYIPRVQTPFQSLTTESLVLPSITTKINPPSMENAPPMTKVERRTYQVLRESQKLLDDSAARTRDRLERNGRTSSSLFQQRSTPIPSSSSCSFNSATLLVPMITSSDSEEYDRLMHESLQRETFGDFVDHFVKFRPEYREQFGLIHEASKRQQAMEKLRAHNQVYAKAKDDRYHNLIDSLTHLPSEQKEKKH